MLTKICTAKNEKIVGPQRESQLKRKFSVIFLRYGKGSGQKLEEVVQKCSLKKFFLKIS